jgi:AAA15 family ATPase/GTPase
MEDWANSISIRNFKSIRHIILEDCRKINLLIGKPNVGKSNILEALTTFSLPYAKYVNNKGLQQFIRVESETELFFNGFMGNDIEIVVGNDRFRLAPEKTSHINKLIGYINDKSVVEISKLNIKSTGTPFDTHQEIKSYFFHTPFCLRIRRLNFCNRLLDVIFSIY